MSPRFSPAGRAISLFLALTVLGAACGREGDTGAAGAGIEAEAAITDSVGATIDGRHIEVHRDPG